MNTLKRIGTVVAIAGLMASVPAAANAKALWAEIPGGVGANYDSSYGSGTGAYAGDTAADSHRVEADYYRYTSSNPQLKLTNSQGNGTYTYSESSGMVVKIRICVVNNNPFDSQTCSAYVS